MGYRGWKSRNAGWSQMIVVCIDPNIKRRCPVQTQTLKVILYNIDVTAICSVTKCTVNSHISFTISWTANCDGSSNLDTVKIMLICKNKWFQTETRGVSGPRTGKNIKIEHYTCSWTCLLSEFWGERSSCRVILLSETRRLRLVTTNDIIHVSTKIKCIQAKRNVSITALRDSSCSLLINCILVDRAACGSWANDPNVPFLLSHFTRNNWCDSTFTDIIWEGLLYTWTPARWYI